MEIRDLHFTEEIVPLFDTVQNEWSRDVLFALLGRFPGSLNAILERQQILRGLMEHSRLLSFPAYHKTELKEVRRWLSDIRPRDTAYTGSYFLLSRFFLSSAGKREKAKLTQTMLFFRKIYQSWFSPLPEDPFPPGFARLLKNCKRFLLEMGVAGNVFPAGGPTLSIREIRQLRHYLEDKTRNGELAVFWDDFFLFEAWLSVSRGIQRHGFVFPGFADGRIVLTGFYHPLVRNPVKNDLTVSTSVNLLTGPNMSGKSTLLRALGICVVLAHLGLAVPANHCEIPYFQYISLSVDLTDDLNSGYSHFMSEVKELKKSVEAAAGGKTCFVVFDELFRGTNAEDALSITATTVKGLTKFKGSYFFVSTHLHQLAEIIMPGFDVGNRSGNGLMDAYYLECKLQGQRPVFTYVLRSGWSELRIGRLLFDQEGLNDLLKISE